MKIGIIGGGVSGVTSAIAAAKNGAEVMILEKEDRLLKKLLLTGNGRCNLTNEKLYNDAYKSSDENGFLFIGSVIERFDQISIMRFFDEIGLYTVTEREGYVYPVTRSTHGAYNVLLRTLKKLNVQIETGFDVEGIQVESDGFIVWEAGGKNIEFDRIILAAGGASYPRTGSDGSGFKLLDELGVPYIEPYPALTALTGAHNKDSKAWKYLSGLRENGKLYNGNKEFISEGQIQFTDYGISGIAVFDISDIYVKREHERIYFSLYDDKYEIERKVYKCVEENGDFNLYEAFSGIMHKRWVDFYTKVLGLSQINKASEIPDERLRSLISLLHMLPIEISGYKGFDFAQVTGGGACLYAIDHNMMCERIPGLYITGELLDVTGICGGYNLHWAFATGMIAGKAAALCS